MSVTTNPQQQGFGGQAGPSSASSDYNKIWFLVRQMIGRIRTATLVQVQSVSNSGGIDPIGTVDVLPLINMIDGFGNPTQHGTIFNLPYCRVQGGANAIILDPKIGDIGVAIFADRDISTVKSSATQGGGNNQANPGSRRRHDWADGLYVFSVIANPPIQYIQFTDTGINIMCPALITITAPIVNVMGVLQVNGVPVEVP